MHFSIFSMLFLSAALALCADLDPTILVYEFPRGVWLENLAVRPCGSILLTTLTKPDLYMVDPLKSQPQPKLLHTFSSTTWLTGITETTPDTFYVSAANGSLKTLEIAPGSNRLFRVSFPPNKDPNFSSAATVTDAKFINGITRFSNDIVLAADSQTGVVWAVNVATGVSRIAVNDPLLANVPGPPPIGVNGIKIRNGRTLYFTNSAQNIFGKVELKADGTAAGPAVIVTHSLPGDSYDDFAFDHKGDAFLATASGNSVAELMPNGKQEIIAGNINSTEIAEPTSAQFGRTRRDKGTLYVTTAGGLAVPVNGNEVVGGQLVAVDVMQWTG